MYRTTVRRVQWQNLCESTQRYILMQNNVNKKKMWLYSLNCTRNQSHAPTKTWKKNKKGKLTLFWHNNNQTKTVTFTKTSLPVELLYLTLFIFSIGCHDIVPTADVLPEAVEPYFFSNPSFVQVVLSTTTWLSRTIVPWTPSQREVTLAVTGSELNISLKYTHGFLNVTHKILKKADD